MNISKNTSPNKILLTGGGGFIGKNIIERLRDRYDILAPRSSELDLTNDEAVNEYFQINKPDLIIHAASHGVALGQGSQDLVAYHNLRMYFNIINAKGSGVRLIVLGSGAEYDKRMILVDVKEEDSNLSVPDDQYAFSKYVMSKFAQSSSQIVHLRLFGVFGPYENFTRRFISNVICMALFDLPITMKQNAYFDYLYIDDFINVLETFITEDNFKYKIYNVGRGEKIDLLSLAKLILNVTGKSLPINIVNDGLNREYTCNVDRLKQELPNIIYTDIKTAINEMVEYYKKELPKIDKNIFLSNS